MDKSWMLADKRSLRFQTGFENFLQFASANAADKSSIRCPCLKCCNHHEFTIGVIKGHVYFNGIMTNYRKWSLHGETSSREGNSDEESESVDMPEVEDGDESESEEMSCDSDEFLRLVEDGDKALYPGCTKSTKLNTLVEMFNLKARHGMTDSCYSDWLMLFGSLLPNENEVPNNLNEAKKTLSVLGMGYEKIHACPNDCILYRGDHHEAEICPECSTSRYKIGKNRVVRDGVPAKVLWYFPIIPRFKRMFQSPKTAKALTWHADRKKDAMMRHPADSPTWKLIDTKWPEFGKENRNLRLTLSSDGFNPHAALSSKYSCWPVILVIYNLPPWLCMKRKFLMLSLLISGPKQPGKDIDVYLQPLIHDLKLMWLGIFGVYDAIRGEYFTLRGVLFWTINDLPAYGNLSGSVTKGYNACPVCVDKSKPYKLKRSKKMVFLRSRRWTERHHPYRRHAAAFDNTIEKDVAPEPLTGEEVLARVEGLPREFGKAKRPAKRSPDQPRPCWKKKSVFFELDYWKYIPVRHILDVMHIEKNCCDAIIGTLLNIPGKAKDGVNARLDMVNKGIKTDVKVVAGEKKTKLPLGSWNLLHKEKKIVCGYFFGMSVPTGFSSNIRNLVSMEDLKLAGLKPHDCHTVMQYLLPVALRSVLEKPVRYAIIRFCLFFKAICSKVIDVSILKQMQADLVDTVCLLEKFFPPSFFDVMIHLTLHLVREVEWCGPMFFRWMYPFERYMKVFKGYVKNRHFPEGCIAEKYIVEEAIEFLEDRVLSQSGTTVGIPSTSIAGHYKQSRPLSRPTMVSVYGKQMHLAHLCVLQNTQNVQPYFKEHKEYLKLIYPNHVKNKKWMREKEKETFPDWLKERVANQLRLKPNNVSQTIRWLAAGPKNVVPTYAAYHVNGVDFNTKERDNVHSFQNSGVTLLANAMQVASARDQNPSDGVMDFYGVIKSIWEVDYYKFRVPVFYCDWVESTRGIKVDELGFTLVKLNKLGHLNDPFVLATHLKQIFYIENPVDVEWSVVVRCPNKDYRGIDDDDEDDDLEEEQPFIPTMPSVDTFDDVAENNPSGHMRDGDEGIWVDNNSCLLSMKAMIACLIMMAMNGMLANSVVMFL